MLLVGRKRLGTNIRFTWGNHVLKNQTCSIVPSDVEFNSEQNDVIVKLKNKNIKVVSN